MQNSFDALTSLTVGKKSYQYFDINKVPNSQKLPVTLKILLENLLRHEDGKTVKKADILAFEQWLQNKHCNHEIAYRPARVLLQDFTGVPAVVDLAAMRDALKSMHGDANAINPLCAVDLVIDHSVQVDTFGNANALLDNTQIEMQRNHERYSLLKWAQQSFSNFQAVPPGTGICHQVNLEYLAQVVCNEKQNNDDYAFPDTLVGTDSHTTMINGLGVLGWGVGGIEAEAAMLGQPISMLIPEVIGFQLTGQLPQGVTATDLVLTITQRLREKGVVGKFVEFYGSGLKNLPLADRATIANMAPEYGATCGFFPIDQETLKYLQLTGRDAQNIALVQAYAKAQGLWHDENNPAPQFTDELSLDLSSVLPSVAGPKRPQDRVLLSDLKQTVAKTIRDWHPKADSQQAFASKADFSLHHGDIVIAAITSCTNTSNPSVMIAAGLVAKKALEKGLQRKPWVKSSLAPGSKVVTDYLEKTNLMIYLNKLGFYLVGYGCTTCIGNSGPLPKEVSEVIDENDLVACSVLSGNRNFEGRIHPQVKANWLASPPLVVAFSLAGTMHIDLTQDALGHDDQGNPVYLKDIWPSEAEIATQMQQVTQQSFTREYAQVFKGDQDWRSIQVKASNTYDWDQDSTYVRNPPYFQGMQASPEKLTDIHKAHILALLGDSVTTDHISPAGSIKPDSPAGKYLTAKGVKVQDFNSYGSRRGNHEVMMRGTFANIRIRNEMLAGIEGGVTKHIPSGKIMPIFDAAMQYQQENLPLVVIAGKEYGTGSSRDWAAKGTLLLGVKAVIAESFERIHRSNLIGMGVLPLQFPENTSRKTLNLDGSETISLTGITDLSAGATVKMLVEKNQQTFAELDLLCRIDTENELNYYRHGGILHYVLRHIAKNPDK